MAAIHMIYWSGSSENLPDLKLFKQQDTESGNILSASQLHR